MNKFPNISIVINTLNRAATLTQTLLSLRWQRYPGNFEVIVVNGPSTDNTDEVLSTWSNEIRVGACPIANLSVSRNIGIAMAQGEIVAFIDDDAVPEPEWLSQIAEGYDSDEVGGVGGFVFDHTGYNFQYQYCLVNRLGDAENLLMHPTEQFSFPNSYRFSHLLGTNCSFRRSVLLEIHGFDEEFEYFLDETDVCVRIIDAGYIIKQLDKAFVHHKYAPSNLRTINRVITNYYPSIKNKIYFSLKHARNYFSVDAILEKQKNMITEQIPHVEWNIAMGLLDQSFLTTFKKDTERALQDGIKRGLANKVEGLTSKKLERYTGNFLPFKVLTNNSSLTVVLVSRDYPPNHNGGIARFVNDLAVELSAQGHIVHVITESKDINRVDFMNGVWIHRILVQNIPLTTYAAKFVTPQHMRNWSASALKEVRRISSHHTVDVIEAPIWDCEGIAFLEEKWPLVTSLQTTLSLWVNYRPELLSDQNWMKTLYEPVFQLERELMEKSSAIRSISHTIAHDLENIHKFKFKKESFFVSPLGITADSSAAPKPLTEQVTVLFVGRLEPRKGIDLLLEAIPQILAKMPQLIFKIIGDSNIPLNKKGKTYRAEFEKKHPAFIQKGSVVFLGKVDEQTLQESYHTCDIFVAPSRYESFGLIFLEAMRAYKPVIGCAVGGIPEIVSNEKSGLLIPPNDVASLIDAILRLARSPELRLKMGEYGAAIFNEKFTAKFMAKNSILIYIAAKNQKEVQSNKNASYIKRVASEIVS